MLAAVVMVGMTAASPASASLIPLDSRFGPDTIIRDTEGGFDWLALPVTRGVPIRELLAAVEDGGRLEEFRFGTREEFLNLITFFTIVPLTEIGGFMSCSTCNWERALDFIELFGGQRPNSASGVFTTPVPGNGFFHQVPTFALRLFEEQPPVPAIIELQFEFDPRTSYSGDYFLLREQFQVPEPAAALLFGAGFIGLALARRQRNVYGEQGRATN
jgi:hypothetical protein